MCRPSRRTGSETSPSSATADRARRPWPRRCSSPPAPSHAQVRVEDGNTVCDFDPEAARRQISVSLAVAPFELDGHKVNLIDTPGFIDFVGDVAAALRVADLAVFVVSAVEGVEVQTEIAWRLAEERGIPRAIFVNKLDRERASFDRTLEQLKDRFGAGVAPPRAPDRHRGRLPRSHRPPRGHHDHVCGGGLIRCHDRIGGPDPRDYVDTDTAVHDAIVEGIVVADDDLMERYLADETIDVKELVHALADGIADATVFPVLCGSAAKLIAINAWRFIVDEGPAPSVGDGPAAAFVFKTLVDPYVGRINLFKVLQGTLEHDAVLVNGRTVADERLHQLVTVRGKEQRSRRSRGGRRPRCGRQVG